MFSTKPLHSFRLTALTQNLFEIKSLDDLSELNKITNGSDFVFIGEGSNTVFIEDYTGTVIVNKLVGIELQEQNENYLVSVNSGCNWHEFVIWCLSNSIYGLENLALIPGTVGACPIQNIGAYGVEVKMFIESVEYFNLQTNEFITLDNNSCNFGYRDSIFKHELSDGVFITKVNFKFPKLWQPIVNYSPLNTLDNPSAQDIFDKVCETRQLKLPDPNLIGNAGSFFKNPIVNNDKMAHLISLYNEIPNYPYDDENKKVAAGWLIEQSGLKGYVLGNVAVHDKQALVLTNKTGDATGEELIKLANHIMDVVYKKFEIYLEPEVRFIGKNGEVKFNDLTQSTYG